MDALSSSAMPSRLELRAGLAPSPGCPRRIVQRAPRLVTYANGFQQRNNAITSNDLEPPAPVAPPIIGNRAEEDFLRRARQMQRRIAKLKLLQERLTQLKEETDTLGPYAEASSSDGDSDSDPDDDSPTASTSAALRALPKVLPGSGSAVAPFLRPPGPYATAEELRQRVAAILAESTARAGSSITAGTSGSSISSGNGTSSSTGNSTNWDSPRASTLPAHPMSSQPLAPQPSAAPASNWEAHEMPVSATPPHPGSTKDTMSSRSFSNGSSWSPASPSTALPSPSLGPTDKAPLGGAESGEDVGSGLRRYTVRYSSPTARPEVVQLSPPGNGTAPSGPVAAAGQLQLPTPPQQQHQIKGASTVDHEATDASPEAPGEAAARRSRVVGDWRGKAPLVSVLPFFPSDEHVESPPQPPKQQLQPQRQVPGAGAAGSSSAVEAKTSAVPTYATVPAVSKPARDPNAELRATIFPKSLTSTNPYTLYDMPLPPLAMPKSWQTAVERQAEEAAAAANAGGGGTAAANAATTDRTDRPRDLVFVTAEAAPWSKTGGLGDVMGALPCALAARGHRVMVVSPRYLSPSLEGRYSEVKDTGLRTSLQLGPGSGGGGGGGGGIHEVGYFHTHKNGVDWVFVDHMSYHRDGTPYGNAYGTYGDNLFRFSLLSLAACEAPLLLHIGGYRHGKSPGLPYGQDVTFIANDWHAGLVPVYVAAKYRRHGVFTNARCILAVHNLAHQGAHPPHCFDSLGLPGEWYGALEWVQNPGAGGTAGGMQQKPTINILKAALVTSDRLVTVSPAYAWEITTDPRANSTTTTTSSGGVGRGEGAAKAHSEGSRAAAARADGDGSLLAGGGYRRPFREDHGMGLGSLLRQRAADLSGIVNGIDTTEWDPRTAPYLPRNYHEGRLGGKGLCKVALQEAFHLPVDPAAPLLGFIGRLDFQKGPDLVLQALPKLVASGCQVVLLGSGALDYEEAFQAAAAAYPDNVRAHVGFSVPLSHRILAASDILLMPSRFEPCGLNQLYAMRYGTIPVAHGTGGLRDTIDEVKPFLGEKPIRTAAEDLDELFTTGLAWGRRTPPRSADDPSTINAKYYQPFQDYFGSGGRYGPVDEEDNTYGSDNEEYSHDADLPAWRRGLGRSRDPGTGWTFSPASVEALLDAVSAALAVYEHHPDKWRRIQLAGMRRDFSWAQAARQWDVMMDGVHAAAAYCK